MKRFLFLALLLSSVAFGDTFFQNHSLITKITETTAAGGTTTLDATANQVQLATGTTTQVYALPNASTLRVGFWQEFVNDSTGNILIKDNNGIDVLSVPAGSRGKIWLSNNLSNGGVWRKTILGGSSGGGGGGSGNVTGPASSTDSAVALWDGITGQLLKNSLVTISGSNIAGNASTATAFAANPTDCGSDVYATGIDTQGNLTCAAITNASTTGTAANTPSTLVLRDGSGNFAATTVTAALSGNATTATALASNPSDCSASQFANSIVANGNLGCAQPAFTDISATATVTQTTVPTQTISASDIDWSTGTDFDKTLAADTTFTFSNLRCGQTITVQLTNTASNRVVTWPTNSPANVYWTGGTGAGNAQPVQTTGSKTDVWTFKYDCKNFRIYGSVIQNIPP